jgi:hypothetical protein
MPYLGITVKGLASTTYNVNPIHRAMTIPSGSLLEWLIIATFG